MCPGLPDLAKGEVGVNARAETNEKARQKAGFVLLARFAARQLALARARAGCPIPIHCRPSCSAYSAACNWLRNSFVSRTTRSVVVEPEPERIETELAYQPFSRTLTRGEIRYLPTVMGWRFLLWITWLSGGQRRAGR